MDASFLIPKDPRLQWSALWPGGRCEKSLSPVFGDRMIHLFWARNAIFHGLRALEIKPGDNVLIPSYHCRSLVEPILEYGSAVKFYNMGIDLEPDLNDVERQIDSRTRAILAIHYFGFPQPIQKFRDLCDTRKLYLIEDCAHVLARRTTDRVRLGDSGDISIFSWRKFLPIYDGGQLVINNPKLKFDAALDKGDFLFRLKVAKNTFERLFEDSRGGRLRKLAFFPNVASSLSRCLAHLYNSAAKARQVNSYAVEFDLKSVNLAMSSISKHILDRTVISEITEKRRSNYVRLANSVNGMAGVSPLFTSLPENVCPWIFPLLVHGKKDFQMLLRAKGIPATSWGGVIHPSLPLQYFPKARVLYDSLMFIPIHQSLDERDLETIIRVLGETLNESVGIDAKGFDDCIPLSALSGR